MDELSFEGEMQRAVHAVKKMNPLLESGRLVMTVPDRLNSRNQKYITARMI